MAGEGSELRQRRIDLNLYLGLPRSPRPRSSDLGSDLALSSLPLSTSSSTEESRAPPEMISGMLEAAASHAPYSPSHASFTTEPEPDIQPVDPVVAANGGSDQDDTPYSLSHEPYMPVPAEILESEQPNARDSRSLNVHPWPIPQEMQEPVFPQPVYPESHVSYPPSFSPSSYVPQPPPSYIPLDPEEPADDPMPVSPLRATSPFHRTVIQSLQSDISLYASPMSPYNPSSPSYSPPSPTYSPPLHSFAPFREVELLGRDDESSSRREIFDSPEYRFRRLIESSHQLRLRRYRPSLPDHASERISFSRAASNLPEEQLMHDVVSSHRSVEAYGKHKLPAEGITTESSEDDKEGKSKAAANFECNICLDMAQEPVVTSCGHLFCWPCLYQWLHVHSEHRECPVCKGEVTESNITPIYGRGGSEANEGEKVDESGESNIKIPPRPRGNRFESLRQQLRPISRRFGEGFASSWRRLVNQQMRNRSRFDGHGDPHVPGVLGGGHHAVLTRLRARRLLRQELNAEIGNGSEDVRLPRDSTPAPESGNPNSLLRDGIDFWHRPRSSTTNSRRSSDINSFSQDIDFWHRSRESTAIPRSNDAHPLFRYGNDPWHQPRDVPSFPLSNDMDLFFSDRDEFWHRFNLPSIPPSVDFGRGAENGNRYGASTSSVNPPSPVRLIPRANVASATATDQVSASSTAAMIQGDVGLPEGSAEPNSAGSSRSYRRRRRSSASESFDVNGVLHERKRRRLN